VSSITNDVCRLESSLPRKRIWTVCPLNCSILNECCWYPVAWFRFENVPRVAKTVVPAELSTWTWRVSKAVVVVVSAVSIWSQKLKVALVMFAGIVTVWVAVSV